MIPVTGGLIWDYPLKTKKPPSGCRYPLADGLDILSSLLPARFPYPGLGLFLKEKA